MAAAWIMAIAALASTAMAGYQYATAPGMPKAPNLANATRAGTEAEAETLADRRRLESAAQQGTSATYHVAKHKEQTPWIKYKVGSDSLYDRVLSGKGAAIGDKLLDIGTGGIASAFGFGTDDHYVNIPYKEEDWKPGGKYYVEGRTNEKWINNHLIKREQTIQGHDATADFTGYGQADVEGKLARQNAENVLALEKKYGPQFIEAALKQQELADPEGTAARKRMLDLIHEQENAHPNRPVADLLDSQISDELHAGRNLDKISDSVLRDAVAQAQGSRGEASDPNLDFSDPLTQGAAGTQRLLGAQRKANSWLASGATPEDVDYRRRQQIISNLSSFANGRTPQSEFSNLSGAQTGPAPYNTGRPLPTANGSSGGAAQSGAMSAWGMKNNFDQNQVSPWMAGLSALLKGATAYSSATFKPGTG